MGGLFGKKPPPKSPGAPPLSWLEAADNPWNVRVLDMRQTALGLVSTTSDPKIAAYFNSMVSEDGERFRETPPLEPETPVNLEYRTQGPLPEGILFSPGEMEDKWALFFYAGRILCVRSWTGEVGAIGLTRQEDSRLVVSAVQGALRVEPVEAAFDFLMRSHALSLVYPAPLQEPVTDQTPLLYFSLFGRRAQFASLQRPAGEAKPVLGSITRLHLACVQGDGPAAVARLDDGTPVTVAGSNGQSPLHWAAVGGHPELVLLLLSRGSPSDTRDDHGCTPLMASVQSRKSEVCRLLLEHGAAAGAADGRGFTALHRAAEMGQVDIVELLLQAGAEPHPEAEGHTPLSLATREGHAAVVQRLQ